MATQNPSNAPGDLPAEPCEDATAAAVLSDDQAGATSSGVDLGASSTGDVPPPGAVAAADTVSLENALIQREAVRQASASTSA